MSSLRTVSIALLSGCIVIFFVARPPAGPATAAFAQLPHADAPGQAAISRLRNALNVLNGVPAAAPSCFALVLPNSI